VKEVISYRGQVLLCGCTPQLSKDESKSSVIRYCPE
jgi:hypothetical protein